MSSFTSHAIDAVLPLVANDLPRFRILFLSLDRFYRARGTLWVVVPDRQLQEIRAQLVALCGDALESEDAPPSASSASNKSWIRLLAETTVVPELTAFPWLKGWYRQQLVKLAIADVVETEFYITLDADVVATRPIEYASLIIDGRSVCRVYALDLHPDWYQSSRKVLGLTPKRSGISHNVTPALLHRDAVRALAKHLEARATESRNLFASWSSRLRGALAAFSNLAEHDRSSWRWYLASHAPWTEYALYYTFLEATDQFDHWHIDSTQGLYDRELCVWRDSAANFEHWDPATSFGGEGLPSFVVIQSIAKLDPERIWNKVAPFIEG